MMNDLHTFDLDPTKQLWEKIEHLEENRPEERMGHAMYQTDTDIFVHGGTEQTWHSIIHHNHTTTLSQMCDNVIFGT